MSSTKTASGLRPAVAVSITIGVLLVAVLVAAGWWLTGGRNLLQSRTVEELIANDPRVHPQQATSRLCQDPGCIEGWDTDYGAFLRFQAEGMAEHWATVLGDKGRRWKTIVLDMRDRTLTFDEQRYAIDLLFSAHDWG